jgi:RNA-directed DNA polymerase
MRLSHHLVNSVGLAVDTADELVSALGTNCGPNEADEIRWLFGGGLPPVTSLNALAVMTGYNLGFVWSLIDRSEKYYRIFEIPKGRGTRRIEAPRVALKLIQKWLSVHFEHKWKAHEAVHGFVRRRSHITAARVHVSADWVISLDIENFFPSTPAQEVRAALARLGYQSDESLSVLVELCCFGGRLAQGAPSSPVISNIALHQIDEEVALIAARHEAKNTRYADDIVLSGKGAVPDNLFDALEGPFVGTPWRLSDRKRSVAQLPNRLKVHGLLVHGDKVRLTKGYRNRIRAFRYLYARGRIAEADIQRIVGHLNYSSQVE